MPRVTKRPKEFGGVWVPADGGGVNQGEQPGKALSRGKVRGKKKRVFRILTVRGKQEQTWLDSNLWQPLQETITPTEARAPQTVVYYGTYGSDGMRRDGSPGGAYSAVFDQYAMEGQDLYTRDEARQLKQWDTRKPFPGFDPKLGSKTLDIFSDD